jgi:transcriptional regulator GlxA family with amidase domain
MMHPMAARRIVFLLHDGLNSIDLAGPVEVFHTADQEVGRGAYELVTVAAQPTVRTSAGLTITPDRHLDDAPLPHTLVVPGGLGTARALGDQRLIAWIRATAPRCTRVTSVCSGAFLLAEAGLLDGRRATTHWSSCDQLAARYPDVTVLPDPVFVRDGHVATSAGVTAGKDHALALVEDDLGAPVARAVARRLVLFVRRPGNQAQFSHHLQVQATDDAALADLQGWIADHPHEDLRVPALARRVAMSERHFLRRFRHELGTTPARFVAQVRLEAARRRLEESDDPIDRVAATTGFGTTEALRRTFAKELAVTPSAYRHRFRTTA